MFSKGERKDQREMTRELQFYKKISSSEDPECKKWRELAPAFHGTEMIVGPNGKETEHIVLGKRRT